jgi:cytochrome c biogenesis protein CcdA
VLELAIDRTGCRKSISGGSQESVMSSSEGPERRPVIPARQARQRVIGHNVQFVLGFSIAAVVIVLAIIWIVYFA